MKQKRYSGEQTIQILKEAEAVMPVANVNHNLKFNHIKTSQNTPDAPNP